MPGLSVIGMPPKIGVSLLHDLKRALAEGVADIEELGITKYQVHIFFPADLAAEGRELYASVDDLFIREGRTLEVKQKVTEAIGARLLSFAKHELPNCVHIEVVTRSVDQSIEANSAWQPHG